MDNLISVIVPCYNVEKYIEKTIDSIEKQTYKNIEIIAIDDCSSDNTYSILEKLQAKYDNLIIYKNKKNNGAAFSRNFAMEKANGEYIGFVDSDDYIVDDYYEKLLDSAIENETEIVTTDIEIVDEIGKEKPILVSPCNGEVTKYNIIDNGLSASPCNKLFKAETIKQYPFLQGKINEDVASILPAVANSNKVGYVSGIKYFYIQRNGSVQNDNITMKRLDMFDSIKCCFERIKHNEEFEKYKEVILYYQVILLYMSIIPKLADFESRLEILTEFMKRQEEYKLHTNKFIKKFIKEQPKKERAFYKKINNALKRQDAEMANLAIENRYALNKNKEKIKDVIRFITKRTVIKRYIELKDLEKLAIKQSKKKQNEVKISVVLPNYNYEKFLLPRLYSILNQTEKIYEIILLDDCSKDNSRILIDQIVEILNPYINIKKEYNTQNSGCAFKQWKKGFEMATGDYVWITEADDCCEKNLLEELVNKIKVDNNIYIAYVDTAFINAWDKIILPTIKPEIDIMKTNHWENDFIDNGLEEIKKYAFLNCTIANVSSCLIKRDNYDDVFEKAQTYKQAGDWMFYVSVMKKGDIAFVNKPLNYYRLHGNNVTSTTKKQKHFDEIKKIHSEIADIIELEQWQKDEITKRYEFLTKVWNLGENEDEEN